MYARRYKISEAPTDLKNKATSDIYDRLTISDIGVNVALCFKHPLKALTPFSLETILEKQSQQFN